MIVIGGSASSGSSLLARILNRHSEVACGPETSVFARPQLITSWNKYRWLLGRKSPIKLNNCGWHRYYGVTIDPLFYGVTRAEISKIATQFTTFFEFILWLEHRILIHCAKSLWIEKTPSNVYSFDLLLDRFPQSKVIMTIRDPYDSIASLVRRGFSPVYAGALFLTNVSYGHKDDPRSIQVTYEDLVINPNQCIKRICDFCNVFYEKEMFIPEEEAIIMKGWQYDESGVIGRGSIGGFSKLPKEQKTEIKALVQVLEIDDNFKIKGATGRFISIRQICDHFGYNFKPVLVTKHVRDKIKNELRYEKLVRTLKCYPTGMGNFPIRMNNHDH